jgi:hypothetical protein
MKAGVKLRRTSSSRWAQGRNFASQTKAERGPTQNAYLAAHSERRPVSGQPASFLARRRRGRRACWATETAPSNACFCRQIRSWRHSGWRLGARLGAYTVDSGGHSLAKRSSIHRTARDSQTRSLPAPFHPDNLIRATITQKRIVSIYIDMLVLGTSWPPCCAGRSIEFCLGYQHGPGRYSHAHEVQIHDNICRKSFIWPVKLLYSYSNPLQHQQ